MPTVDSHPEKNVIRVRLRQNLILKEVADSESAKLEPRLVIVDRSKGDFLLHQDVHEIEQYFILDGILKRVVTNQLILRSADEWSMETRYFALLMEGLPGVSNYVR